MSMRTSPVRDVPGPPCPADLSPRAPAAPGSGRCVLAVGAHPDDIELGCGATLHAHRSAGDRVVMLVLTDGSSGGGTAAVRRAEQAVATARIGAEIRWGGFRDGWLGGGPEVIGVIERVIREVGATTVYTHAPDDTHQDHRAASQSVTSAARDAERLLYFESPSSVDFRPHLYCDVTRSAGRKMEALRAHASQVAGSRRVDLRAVASLMSVRGFQSGVDQAEAFMARRFVFDPNPAPAADRTALPVPVGRPAGERPAAHDLYDVLRPRG
ncbi:PIG-L deacetylase family protein [Streptomyces anulatus]|uniref:PIG-L deacetylase family protein n=1 Tax=Streptomyces anulatus TaxID=1892 RepID=UPI001674A766|nr:PIG-L family deacetylase [Streptomyces anulatus]